MNTQKPLTFREQRFASLAKFRLSELEKYCELTCECCGKPHKEMNLEDTIDSVGKDIHKLLKSQHLFSHQVRKIKSTLSAEISASAEIIYQRQMQSHWPPSLTIIDGEKP